MPEHDTFDLDAAFRDLEHDIAGISSPRGAGAAIATARRRRRTTIGAVAAAAVLVVGAVAVGQGIATRSTSVGPAQLPPPAPFDAQALSAATRGWVADWHSLTTPGEISLKGDQGPHCLAALADDVDKPGDPGPDGSGGGVFASRSGAASLSWLTAWGDNHPDASTIAYAAVVASFDGCATASPDRQYTWEGGVGRSWTITFGQQVQHIWVARTDRALGVLWGRAPIGAVPDDVDRQVMSALVAGLQSPKSFNPIPSSPSTAESSPPATELSAVSRADFARALSGWDNAWQKDGAPKSDMQVPCADAWDAASEGGGGSNLGANGDQELRQFGTVGEAQAAVDVLRKSLTTCAGSAYQVARLTGVGGTALVASGPNVVWAVQHGTAAGVIVIPGGSSAPPDHVTADVVTRLSEAMSPDPGPTTSGV